MVHRKDNPSTTIANANYGFLSGVSRDLRAKRLGLGKNFVWTALGNLSVGATQVIILCLIAQTVSKDAVGRYALALALINPLLAFLSLQLRSMLASQSNQDCDVQVCVALRIATNMIVALIVAVIICLGKTDSLAFIVVALMVPRLFVALSDVFYGQMQRRERMDFIAKSQLLSGSLQVATFALVSYHTENLLAACWAMAVTPMLTLWFYDLPVARSLEVGQSAGLSNSFFPRWDTAAMGRLAWLTLPLGMMTGVVALTASVPRYFLGHFWDVGAVGVFAALACPGLVLQQSTLSLAQAALPRFGQCFANSDAVECRRLLWRVLAFNFIFGALGVLVGVLIGQRILQLFYTAEFSRYEGPFVWMMVSFALNCMGSIGMVLMAAQRFRTQFLISVSTLITTVGLGAILISRYGLMGAALTLVVVSLIRLAIVFFAVSLAIREIDLSNNEVTSRGFRESKSGHHRGGNQRHQIQWQK
ncbi:MAG: oligosaccharide flippase family protein [Planctomycetaceae bacterium]|nr:oligosaccharide flippase family protein [Planctomycetaceae bacterium]